MRLLYFDCFGGASGDMIVGALVDLGVDARHVRRALRSLGIPGLRVAFRAAERHGIAATKFDVNAPDPQPHRGLREIRRLLGKADLADGARRLADSVFRRLCEVEAGIHRVPVEKVHLHEVGAVDSIADVIAAAVCLDRLAPDRVVVSELPLGSGTVTCEHGVLPVPAPATLELLRGVPVRPGPVEAEMVTPTGAAILTAAATEFGPMPRMRPRRTGFGAGDRDHQEIPNLLRVLEGEADVAGEEQGEVVVLEANLDDMNPQVYGHLRERLVEEGALDVFYAPVQMKKDRPGVQVTVLARPGALNALSTVLFRESSTIGVRWHRASRRELDRESVRARTPYGGVTLKVSRLDGEVVQVSPEYDDCQKLARKRGVPLRVVQEAAIRAYRVPKRKR